MTRYSLPVMLSEQFYAVVIMPSKDITMQDFILPDAFCSVPAAFPTLALREVPEESDDHEYDLHDHHRAHHFH